VALHKGSPKTAHSQIDMVRTIQSERRSIDALFRLDAVVQLEEQIGFLVAQLSQGDRDERGPGALSVANLRGEHHRLDGLWRHAQQLRSALVAAEELALMALFEQQDVEPFVEDASAQIQALRRQMPALLLALLPRRDDITLIVQEAGETSSLQRWLLPLLEDVPRRRWVVEARPGLTSKSSDRKRKWGEPMGLEALRKQVESGGELHEVLLSVRGPNAGVFLALEAGVHRYHVPTADKEEVPVLIVKPVAMRSSLSEKELSLPAVSPPTLPPLKQLRLMPAVREHLPDPSVALCDGACTVTLDPVDYFRDFELLLLEHLTHLEINGGLDREGQFSFALDAVKESKR
jgi:ATP-dependent Clp protease ATP-binding subunit ClpC